MATALSACTNYLNVQPQGYVLPTTDAEFGAVVHSMLREIEGGGDDIIFGNMERLVRLEGIADNLDANVRIGNNLPSYAGELINTMQLRYRSYWSEMKDCNLVIENLEGRTTDEAKGLLAATYSIKGLLYYNMIRDYCEPWDAGNEASQLGLPIVEKFNIYDMPLRASLKETYEYALAQFDKALSMNNHDKTYIFTEWVIKSLKAKLLFWAEQWEDCAALCEDILQNSGYKLTGIDAYKDMINSEKAPKGEVILRSHINDSSELDWYFSAIKKYLYSRPASAKFVRLFGETPSDDIRYESCLGSKRFAVKVAEYKIRLSEILLMDAECRYHVGDKDAALAQINALRAARIKDAAELTMDTLPAVRVDNLIVENALGKAVDPLLQAIFDERQKEFFLEGDRWYELKRNGRPEWWIVNNGLKYTTRRYLYTAPIYKNDVDMNPDMKQNPGYES